MNEGRQILGKFGYIPIYILYGPDDPYLEWFNKIYQYQNIIQITI